MHWLDDDFTLKSMILEFHCFSPPHTATAHAEFVYDAIKQYSLGSQIWEITTDNAEPLKGLFNNLQLMLAEDSIELPSDMYLRCGCHVINIAVKKFLDVVNDNLVVVCKLVNSIHASQIGQWIFNVYVTQQNGLINSDTRINYIQP